MAAEPPVHFGKPPGSPIRSRWCTAAQTGPKPVHYCHVIVLTYFIFNIMFASLHKYNILVERAKLLICPLRCEFFECGKMD